MDGAKKTIDVTAYLEMERKASTKHEFRNGEIVAMAGGTLAHNMLAGNAYYTLRSKVDERCTVFNSDQQVYFQHLNNFVYPDLSLVCGNIETASIHEQAIINPLLVIEVLSDQTAAYDRGEKFRKYRSLPTFKEYLLIDQQQPIVDALYRENDQFWRMQTIIGLDKAVPIHSLGVELLMSDLYKDVPGLKTPQLPLDL